MKTKPKTYHSPAELERIRRKVGWSKQKLADEIGISRVAYDGWLKGWDRLETNLVKAEAAIQTMLKELDE